MGSYDFINTTVTGVTGLTTTGGAYFTRSLAGATTTGTYTGISAYVAFPTAFGASGEKHITVSSSNIPNGLAGGALYFVNGLLVSSSAIG